jgi:hypothetical protein
VCIRLGGGRSDGHKKNSTCGKMSFVEYLKLCHNEIALCDWPDHSTRLIKLSPSYQLDSTATLTDSDSDKVDVVHIPTSIRKISILLINA